MNQWENQKEIKNNNNNNLQFLGKRVATKSNKNNNPKTIYNNDINIQVSY